jgi:hypothetical protein
MGFLTISTYSTVSKILNEFETYNALGYKLASFGVLPEYAKIFRQFVLEGIFFKTC